MSDSYVECLVKAKQPTWAKILKVLLVTLTVLSCLVMFVFIIFLPVALAAGVGAYFLNMYTDLEYEYLYLDKELSVDKIMAKSKRKRVGTYSLDRMEVFAPVYSYHLDNFKNRQVKEKDYSIGEVLQPDGGAGQGAQKHGTPQSVQRIIFRNSPVQGTASKQLNAWRVKNIGLVYMIRRTFFIAETEINAVI